ncbi:MAG: hypothetical protein JKY42_04445 [Flavobacteriales bacterium]|nr:hypothetical protein [Flavobacteriales bacterium]
MRIYCTTCSKEKSTQEGKIATIQRYQEERIRTIYNKSQQDNIGFRILSGKYGLLSATDEIPWYDQVLLTHEINNMIDLIALQIEHSGITSIDLFVKDPVQYPDWAAYVSTMIGACEKTGIQLEIKLLD